MQNNQYSLVEKAIITTLSYFDVFQYPLTSMEIVKWIYQEDESTTITVAEIEQALSNNNLKESINSSEGFYYLNGGDNNIQERRVRYQLAEKKYKIALRVARVFRIFPFIQMIGICNSLAFNNAKKISDIDFFIITDQNKIWTTRFITTFFTKIFRLRPSNKKVENKICLSFFVTQEALNLQSTKISDQDPYLHYWIVPIYNPKNIYSKFIEENKWIKNYMPNFIPVQLVNRRQVIDTTFTKSIKRILAVIFKPTIFEKVFKKFQTRIMPKNLKQMANQDSRVIVTDSMLKFHDEDRRMQFEQAFQKKLSSLINE